MFSDTHNLHQLANVGREHAYDKDDLVRIVGLRSTRATKTIKLAIEGAQHLIDRHVHSSRPFEFSSYIYRFVSITR